MKHIVRPGESQNYPDAYFRDYDSMIQSHLEDGSILFSDIKTFGASSFERGQHWLILSSGNTVAFCESLYRSTENEYKLVLCNIEVRDTYRGAGIAREIIRRVEAYYEAPMWTTGSFTPDGFRALSFLPVYPWETAGVKFNPMNFVKNWENLVPNN